MASSTGYPVRGLAEETQGPVRSRRHTPQMIQPIACLLVLCTLAGGDEPRSAVSLDGKPLGRWVEEARDPDSAKRKAAMRHLMQAVDRQDNGKESAARQNAALEVLSRLGPDAKDAAPVLVEQLRGQTFHGVNPRVRYESPIANVLVRIGPEALPAVVQGLANPTPPDPTGKFRDTIAIANGSFGYCADQVIRDIGPAGIPVLQRLQKSKDEAVRGEAARALKLLGSSK